MRKPPITDDMILATVASFTAQYYPPRCRDLAAFLGCAPSVITHRIAHLIAAGKLQRNWRYELALGAETQ